MRNPQGLRVPIRLDRSLPTPLHDQMADQLRQAIDSGQLAAATRMPSTRTMAEVLGISRGVALSAYEILFAEGYVTGKHGSGTYVATRTRAENDRTPRTAPSAPARGPVDLTPGRRTAEAFPIAAWRAAWRRASHHAPPADEPPLAGLLELRYAIAALLRDTRGLVLDHHEIIVVSGYAEALRLALPGGGERPVTVALEDPSPAGFRNALARHATVRPVPVDGAGARVDLIPTGCDAVVISPERNDPLGARMSMERRHALSAWAADHDALIVEPAFDGVYNPSVNPRPSVLASGDPTRTLMYGSFSDILTPSLRLAFLVLPRPLAPTIRARVPYGPEPPSAMAQQVTADLLRSGCATRRLDRLSTLYAQRRTLLRQSLAAYPDTTLLGSHTGTTATLLLPPSLPAAHLTRTLHDRGVITATLADYYHPHSHPKNGIVLGYAHLDEMTLRRALRTLTTTLDTHGLPRHTRTVA
ncbi:GntR family transcriptional regulator [Acrocarpospora phusangensis]|uniref:GntR family transcriptional regulator n=1 Tax=Acrocarpospora phusangensis TaxID=1070424 RepID=A0A919UL49_9ACTN|nr:PLP-dependent aminotransferase family protein [Acrocarpospora phusangensis]GIH25654.1 GntR family transcriptional regulator [Acrocarpospora phusangensis]